MASLLLAVIYLAFISLGLPDSLFGAAWPSVYAQMGVPLSFAGIVSMIISGCTVLSSLQSARLTRRFGAGAVTAVSVGVTAAAMLGFSVSTAFWQLCLWAVPYGLGAGGVDAALNNYVALHYGSKHMSWLHCMWGVGTVIGPYLIGFALSGGTWHSGYRWVGVAQLVLTAVLALSVPLWKKASPASASVSAAAPPLRLREVLKIRGAKSVIAAFFCYCALEQTAMLWISSYMTLHGGFSVEQAADYAGLFFIGITVGRAVNGFFMLRFSNTQMIRVGQALIAVGAVLLLLPAGRLVMPAGLAIIGLGCAPVYPCIIHATPQRFGAENSSSLIGVQMAGAYVGNCFMPPLFGLIANHISVSLLPVYLLALLAVMVWMHETVVRQTAAEK